MKKVLHILPMNKMSGAEKMALLMCKNMKDYDPIVVCGGDNLRDIFQDNGIKSYSIDFSKKNILALAINLSKIIKDENVKIVHAHDNIASLVAYLTRKILAKDIKVISHIHNCYPWLKENGINKKLDSFLRPRYDHNITCGKLVFDYYKENANYFNVKKTTMLSNAIDIEGITSTHCIRSQDIKERYNIPNGKMVFGFIGRLDEQKGIVPFIEELEINKDRFDDCKFILIGNGSQEGEVKELIIKYSLQNLFILAGHQDDIYKFYPMIDVFFLPSLYEGLPMVILEAMAFKKAIVSMDVGSISEVIKDDTGVLVPRRQYSIFIDELVKIKDDKERLKKYGENSYEYVSKNYNIKNYVDSITMAYDKLA